MALAGDLSEFPLTDIIQLCDLSKKTGAVDIDGQRGSQRMRGKLFFRDGRIIGAEMAGLPALEACYTFFTLTSGEFTFVEGEQPVSPSITVSNEVIIMEGIMRQDVWQTIQQHVPSLTLVPRLVPNPSGTTEINLEAEDWRVLTMVNGKNTVAQIAQRSGLGEFRTCEIIAQLLADGLIEKREALAEESIQAELERIATATLGSNAPTLLQEACRQAHVEDLISATIDQIGDVLTSFEQITAQLIGPQPARVLSGELRDRAFELHS
jgi:hypothetical protein